MQIRPDVQGPQWSADGLDIARGRYPLSVERHVMRMVDRLVPAVTAVTPHGRYYALHGLIAAESDRLNLDVASSMKLLRRAEVALAAVSFAHHDGGDIGWLPRAHGVDALSKQLSTGALHIAEAAVAGKGGYVQSDSGFWNPYAGSEVTLGILLSAARPTSGPQLDEPAVRAGLGDLLDLAAQETLQVAQLKAVGDKLCVCAGGSQADGRWLSNLMCAPGAQDTNTRAHLRRQTIRLLARIVDTHDIDRFTRDVGNVFAFGKFLTTDHVTSGIETAALWRGTILRNYPVGAWRRLWSWLVEQVGGQTVSSDELADAFADQLPGNTSVAALVNALPPTQDADEIPLPAERNLREVEAYTLPLAELQVLAVSTRRIDELTGRTRDTFLGQRGVELGPEWFARRLSEAGPQQLRDFARRLTSDLLDRALRVALSKARRRPDGTLWLPTRLHQNAGLLFATSSEGRGDVGLRLDQMGSVLASSGVLAYTDGHWTLTQTGRSLVA